MLDQRPYVGEGAWPHGDMDVTGATMADRSESEHAHVLPSATLITRQRETPEATASEPAGRAVLVALDTVQPTAVQWLWPRYIPLGKITVLDGDPGLGKSLITLNLAARVSAGAPMPDGTASDLGGPAGVVLLSAEDDLADTIRPRLDAAGADVCRVMALSGVTTGNGADRPPCLLDLPELEQAILSVDARLVVIDPFMAHLPGKTDSHRDQDVRALLAPLAQLASRTRVAFVIVRHLNKSGGGNPTYRGGGSIGILGAARSGLLVGRDPDDPSGARRILAITKMNVSAEAPARAYHVETGAGGAKVVWEGPTEHTAEHLVAERRATAKGTLADAVAFLSDELAGGPMPAEDGLRRATAAGIAPRTLARAKSKLGVLAAKRGQPGTSDQAWCWSLPEGGQRATKAAKVKRVAGFDGSGANRRPKLAPRPKVANSRMAGSLRDADEQPPPHCDDDNHGEPDHCSDEHLDWSDLDSTFPLGRQ